MEPRFPQPFYVSGQFGLFLTGRGVEWIIPAVDQLAASAVQIVERLPVQSPLFLKTFYTGEKGLDQGVAVFETAGQVFDGDVVEALR